MLAVRSSLRAGALGLLALLVSAGTPVPALALVDNVVYNPATGHYYKYVSGTSTWAQSKAGAAAIGGYLCTYSSQAEIDWTLANLATGTGSVWIGGTDGAVEGTWTWDNGDPWTFANWNSGEPNNSGDEDFLMMYTNPAGGANYGKWNDAPTAYTLPGYIVEWNSDPNPPPPPVLPAPPTNLQASLSYQGSVLLSWTDASANETSFQMQRMPAGGAFAALATLGANTTAHEDTDLSPLVTYTYRVRAVNAVGPSDWSNEASATSGTYTPTTPAPSDLLVVDVSPTTVDLQWTDRSDGETGFEVHRKKGNGTLALVAKTAPNATAFHDSGLSPDTAYGYAVRSVGTLRASGFIEGPAATEPTLAVAAVKGDLKDSPAYGKDSLKATFGWGFLEGISDGSADPVTEGIAIRAGGAGAPILFSLLPDDPGWKGKGAKRKWKSPAGSATKFQVQVDTAKRTVVFSAAGIELPLPPANPVSISLSLGNDAGTGTADWAPQKKPGWLKLK